MVVEEGEGVEDRVWRRRGPEGDWGEMGSRSEGECGRLDCKVLSVVIVSVICSCLEAGRAKALAGIAFSFLIRHGRYTVCS